MMNVVPYDPLELFDGVVESVLPELDRVTGARSDGGFEGTFPIDVAETDTSYRVWADLPGVRKEDVNVSILGNQVSLLADTKREKAVDQRQGSCRVLRRERPSGTLARTLQLAGEIDDARARAEYRDGVLVLTLPKKESAQVKRLAIH